MLIKMKQQWTCITVNLTLSVLENKRNFSEFIKTILVNKEELGAKMAFIPVKFWANNSLLKYTFRDQ